MNKYKYKSRLMQQLHYHRNYFENICPLTAAQKQALDYFDDTNDNYLIFCYIMRLLDIIITDRPERRQDYLITDVFQCILDKKAEGRLRALSDKDVQDFKDIQDIEKRKKTKRLLMQRREFFIDAMMADYNANVGARIRARARAPTTRRGYWPL